MLCMCNPLPKLRLPGLNLEQNVRGASPPRTFLLQCLCLDRQRLLLCYLLVSTFPFSFYTLYKLISARCLLPFLANQRGHRELWNESQSSVHTTICADTSCPELMDPSVVIRTLCTFLAREYSPRSGWGLGNFLFFLGSCKTVSHPDFAYIWVKFAEGLSVRIADVIQ